MKLTDFKVLTFDCYGTLIDWESGIFAALQPLLQRCAPPPARNAALEAFARHESAVEEASPRMLYSDVLAEVHRRLAREWNAPMTDAEHARFGASVPDWPEFADSPRALQYLGEHYRLAVLSNVDRTSFRASNARLKATFDAVYTAQDIGSYKPDPANFRYLLDKLAALGFGKDDILHTAQSLYHDHATAKMFGLASCWIDRRYDRQGWGATAAPPPDVSFDFRFPSLEAMAEAHRREAEG